MWKPPSARWAHDALAESARRLRRVLERNPRASTQRAHRFRTQAGQCIRRPWIYHRDLSFRKRKRHKPKRLDCNSENRKSKIDNRKSPSLPLDSALRPRVHAAERVRYARRLREYELQLLRPRRISPGEIQEG